MVAMFWIIHNIASLWTIECILKFDVFPVFLILSLLSGLLSWLCHNLCYIFNITVVRGFFKPWLIWLKINLLSISLMQCIFQENAEHTLFIWWIGDIYSGLSRGITARGFSTGDPAKVVYCLHLTLCYT